MSYLNDQILKSLKEARNRKGLSQRELSAKSGVPQSHISKIESGGVDLRISSLIALARVLDLELELIPKKTVPAIKSIVRSSVSTDLSEQQRRMQKEIYKLNDVIGKAAKAADVLALPKEVARPTDALMPKGLDSIMRITSQLEHLQPNGKALDAVARATKDIERALNHNSGVQEAIQKWDEQLKSIRNIAVHSPIPVKVTRPAYSLDDMDDE